MKNILLKKNEEKRILNGHQWIFSNEILKIDEKPALGEIVKILNHENKFLGIGFYNPFSLISIRFLHDKEIEIDKTFFVDRINKALDLRKTFFPTSKIYRLINSEGDFLPGLIIDRYESVFVLQTFSFGMDLLIPTIIETLKEIFNPSCIIEKNNSQLRNLETLPLREGILFGEYKSEEVKIENVKYKLNLLLGQKTGFFLDQRLNRVRLMRYCKNKIVLDAFCNEGGFGLTALTGGAKEVDFVDTSAHSISQVKENLKINKFENYNLINQDAFDFLNNSEKKYDVIILDPPTFTKSKKNIMMAIKGYTELHFQAIKKLTPNGILVTSSCSHHISEKEFFETVQKASAKEKRKIQLLEYFGASCDHPTLVSMPETVYLKCGYFLVN